MIRRWGVSCKLIPSGTETISTSTPMSRAIR